MIKSIIMRRYSSSYCGLRQQLAGIKPSPFMQADGYRSGERITFRQRPYNFAASVILALLCIGMLSCTSVQTDIRYTGDEGNRKEKALADIEAALVTQRGMRSPETLEQVRAEITALLKAPSTDSSYLARLYALAADTALLLQQPNEARKQLALAKRQSEYDEYVQLVSARLIAEPEKRIVYLEERISQNSEAYRLKAEAGGLYFAAKDYRNALAAFDASLSFLPDAYQQYYSPQREQCAVYPRQRRRQGILRNNTARKSYFSFRYGSAHPRVNQCAGFYHRNRSLETAAACKNTATGRLVSP